MQKWEYFISYLVTPGFGDKPHYRNSVITLTHPIMGEHDVREIEKMFDRGGVDEVLIISLTPLSQYEDHE